MTTLTAEKALQGAELLERSADYIQEHGLHRGGFYRDPDGCAVCTLGAIKACNGNNLYADGAWEATNAIIAVIHERHPDHRVLDIALWNDDVATGEGEVLGVMRQAAANLRAHATTAQAAA